jgi:hydroxymethylglutaryl-CoA synthase
MLGLKACGAYVPLYRMGVGTRGWKKNRERAVANYDEDSLTMAVAAAVDCMGDIDRQEIDALYFSSTTSSYAEKAASATVATAIDLRHDILTGDFANSLRGSTTALKAALDAVGAGSARQVLVAAADLRVPQPESELDITVGDGGVALLVSNSDVAVVIEGWLAITDEILDIWRPTDAEFVQSWEDRFAVEEGYFRVLPEVVSSLIRRHNLKPGDFARAVFYAPDPRRHAQMARMLGFTSEQVQDPLFSVLGNTGTAFVLMSLTHAFEEAKPDDLILLANYGNGADAFILRMTENIKSLKKGRGVSGYLRSKKLIDDYKDYLKWRGLLETAGQRRPPIRQPSASALWRERDSNIRFLGVKCTKCGYPQYPPQRVCTRCHTKDQFKPYRFSDKKGTLFTYSADYITPSPHSPEVIAVVNFQGGGRMIAQMTDRDISEIKIGMPLEMSFRKVHYVGGIHNYFWKCLPPRG